MRGYLVSGFSLLGVVFFSVCLFLSDNLSFFWLFLELGTLSLVPSFFLRRGVFTLDSLFSYLVVSSVSSSMIVCGLLFEGVLFLVVVGLFIKFGLFPFLGWIYSVVVGSNWFVVWGFSTFLKSPFLFLCFFLSAGVFSLVNWLCVVTFLVLGFMFWVYSFSWYHCWCHMMVSSSAALVAMSFVLSGDVLFWLYCVYLVWATLVVFFLSSLEGMHLSGQGVCFVFVFLLVSFPFTLSVFYKLVMGFCVYSCFFYVFLGWVFYSVSEQLYLVKYLVGYGVPLSCGSVLRLV
uniref:NADH dehydrogenase subunit 2 n=1 Tax=Brachycladium goliath TaxID=1751714 RepID=A0A140B0Z8_9TREM|nr:NADH dehydrogenase subunit 2 [Brachycladium goliath]ALN38360.1 NADH dehydrogenase subunit 2 [Brachycladium goliath]